MNDVISISEIDSTNQKISDGERTLDEGFICATTDRFATTFLDDIRIVLLARTTVTILKPLYK